MFKTVAVQSGWLSKINWTAAISAILSLLIAIGLPITDSQKVEVMALVGTIGPVLTMILRTYFTTTLTPASADKI